MMGKERKVWKNDNNVKKLKNVKTTWRKGGKKR